MASGIFHLVYASEGKKDIDQVTIDAILNVSRTNNQKLKISGLLLTRGRYFLQMLEGSEPAVRALFSKISHDRRHESIVSLAQTTSSSRMFPQWSMGFIDPHAEPETMEQVWASIKNHEKLLKHDASAILEIFRSFNKG